MTTRKVILTNEYLRLCRTVDNILDKKKILLSTDEFDFIDMLYMFNIYFIDCDKDNYKEKIRNLINIGNIDLTERELNLIYEPIYEFVIWYYQ